MRSIRIEKGQMRTFGDTVELTFLRVIVTFHIGIGRVDRRGIVTRQISGVSSRRREEMREIRHRQMPNVPGVIDPTVQSRQTFVSDEFNEFRRSFLLLLLLLSRKFFSNRFADFLQLIFRFFRQRFRFFLLLQRFDPGDNRIGDLEHHLEQRETTLDEQSAPLQLSS